MTDPLTAADLDTIEQRANTPRLGRSIARETDLDLLAIRRLLAEVRRLRSIVTRWEMEAERAERHGYDLDPHDLLAEVRRQMATEQRVRALHHPVPAPTSQHYHCEPYECDRAGEGELRDECGECGRWCPCPTIVALDGGE